MDQQEVVYSLPGMDQVEVDRDIVYKRVDGVEWRMDVYRPLDVGADEPRPAVVFVHGDAPPEILAGAKDWAQYVSWGRLAAASGLVGITFDHRSTERLTRLADTASDIDDLLVYVRDHADAYRIDRDALCLWTCSAGAPVALHSTLVNTPPFIRCIVAFYALLDLQHVGHYQDLAPGVTADDLRAYSPLHHLEQGSGPIPPVFVARAGLDHPRFNDAIDRFVLAAITRNLPIAFVNHPNGRHAFDVVNDGDATSRRIARRVLPFMVEHAGPDK